GRESGTAGVARWGHPGRRGAHVPGLAGDSCALRDDRPGPARGPRLMTRRGPRGGRRRKGATTKAPARAPAPTRPGASALPKGASRLLLLDHEWVKGAARVPIIDPWTGRAVAQVEQAGPRELDRALDAAR